MAPAPERPRADHQILTRMLARWRGLWPDRDLFRVSAGAGWIRLHLTGDDRPGIVLTGSPLPLLVFRWQGAWPDPVAASLPPQRQHPLGKLLQECRLTGLGMLATDRIAAFRLQKPTGGSLFLLHQVFGAQGNTVLLDKRARLLWSCHRPPHPGLAAPPPDSTWSTGANDPLGEPEESTLARQMARQLAAALAHNRTDGWQRELARKLKAAGRLVENLGADLANADQADQYRRQAEALAANLHLLTQGSSVAEVADPRDGSSLRIPLNAAVPPAANVEAYFRKARKARKGADIIKERLDSAREQASLLTAARDRLGLHKLGLHKPTDPLDWDGTLDLLARLQEWGEDHRDLLPEPRTAGRGRTQETGADGPGLPFRRYLVAKRWEVWVGRNNKENDRLTHEAAHGKDIWLHAQGTTGSHVILRTGGHPEQVPRSVLAQAASLAALHSKARHSSLVPVIWTQRRYVRKVRKAPPGTAVCQREKTIFASPEVPAGVVSI